MSYWSDRADASFARAQDDYERAEPPYLQYDVAEYPDDDEDRDDEEEDELEDEKDLAGCPFYRGTGICTSGCHSEPACQTDRPIAGWPSERAGEV